MTTDNQQLTDQGDPRNPVRYITKICIMCADDFECPSTWRRTQWCDFCQALRKGYREIGHELSNRMAKKALAQDTPCEDCGGDGSIYHHIIPLAKGGGVGLHNLKFLCLDCHAEYHKADTS